MHNVNCQIITIHLNNKAAAPNFKPMSTRAQYKIAAWPARYASKVMVAVIAGPDAPMVATAKDLSCWRRLTPLALWSTVRVRDGSPDEILHGVAAEIARQDVQAHQLILLGEGRPARSALELVLQGALDCAGILAIAIPCVALPFPIVPTAVGVRLVLQRGDCEGAPDDLITALRAADIDERIVRLNQAATHVARTAASAAETFVLELVANASRQGRYGV
jgi:hypothetical protein